MAELQSYRSHHGLNFSDDSKLQDSVNDADISRYLYQHNMIHQRVDTLYRPSFFAYIPRIFRFDNAPIEATGIAMSFYSRFQIFMASLYVGVGMLQLATAEAIQQCQDAVNHDSCVQNARVYGFKPSSLLTNIGVIAGFFITVLLPLIGAIVDHTPYRRQVGAFSAFGIVAIKAIEINLNSRTWFFMACLQVFSAILFQLLSVTEHAYSAELSSDPAQQSKYQTYFFFLTFVSLLIYMLQVLIPGKLLGWDDAGIARLGAAISVFWSSPLFIICWRYLFRDRPALSRISANQSLLTSGFSKLYHTYQTIQVDYPAVQWFLRSVAFSESANYALNTIATTYLSEYMGMPSLQIGMVIIVILIGGIPGTLLGNYTAQRYNPVSSAQLCLALYLVVTSVASVILRPGATYGAFLVGFFWGICKGWLHPIHTALFVTIIPKGQEVELMGLYFFCCQIFSFIPPLMFTVLNEHGLSMQWGLASLNIYFIVGWLGLQCMGTYQDALDRAQARTNSASSALAKFSEDDVHLISAEGI